MGFICSQAGHAGHAPRHTRMMCSRLASSAPRTCVLHQVAALLHNLVKACNGSRALLHACRLGCRSGAGAEAEGSTSLRNALELASQAALSNRKPARHYLGTCDITGPHPRLSGMALLRTGCRHAGTPPARGETAAVSGGECRRRRHATFRRACPLPLRGIRTLIWKRSQLRRARFRISTTSALLSGIACTASN